MNNEKIKKIIVAQNAIRLLSGILDELSLRGKVLLIADNHTFRSAGEQVKASLIDGGYPVQEIILQRAESLVPDEKALGEILIKMDPDIEVLMAVGSGSITDLTRYISYKFRKPFIAVPTAPSMDGYASSVAPLTIHGFKQTLAATPPVAIVTEPEILVDAPAEMILAGFGDLLGKYTSLADWKLSNIINGEGYSQEIASAVRSSLDKTVANFHRQVKDPVLIKNLTEALIFSGEAILQWGNSRPASGAEHHLAHFWEMQAALAGKKSHLHGTKVGIAVILVAELYHKLFQLKPADVKRSIENSKLESEEDYIQRITKVYGPLAEAILADLKGFYRDPVKRAELQRIIPEQWELMKKWVQDNVPTAETIREKMVQAGAPITAEAIDVNDEMLQIAMKNAKEVRTRYTVFRLAEDIGWS